MAVEENVEAALRAAGGGGDERVVVVLAVRERPLAQHPHRHAKQAGGKQALLALTVDGREDARLHVFKRTGKVISQVPLWSRPLPELTRVDEKDAGGAAAAAAAATADGGGGAMGGADQGRGRTVGGFALQFGDADDPSSDSSRTSYGWVPAVHGGGAEGAVAAQKEFLWCLLQICSFQRRAIAHNIDFVDLSLWAQASGLDGRYAARHAVFRRAGRVEEGGLRGDEISAFSDAGHAMQVMMTEEEEADVLELLEQSSLPIREVKQFEEQLCSKLEALEQGNIHSILSSVEVAESVCFALDKAAAGVRDLESWMVEVDSGLADIAQGLGEIEVHNHKLDTVHRNHERLEGVLTEVLAQLDMPEERQRLLMEADLHDVVLLRSEVLPAVRTLVHGLQLNRAHGAGPAANANAPAARAAASHAQTMRGMAVVREKEQEFEALRRGFARRAYAHVGSVFENQSEVWRAVHRAESGGGGGGGGGGVAHYHALGDRRPWYESAPVWTVAQLMPVLKLLDRALFDKAVAKHVGRSLQSLNTKDFESFFRKLKKGVEKKPRGAMRHVHSLMHSGQQGSSSSSSSSGRGDATANSSHSAASAQARRLQRAARQQGGGSGLRSRRGSVSSLSEYGGSDTEDEGTMISMGGGGGQAGARVRRGSLSSLGGTSTASGTSTQLSGGGGSSSLLGPIMAAAGLMDGGEGLVGSRHHGQGAVARLIGLARAGEQLPTQPSSSSSSSRGARSSRSRQTLLPIALGFFYALRVTVQHCNREGRFLRSLFSTPDAAAAAAAQTTHAEEQQEEEKEEVQPPPSGDAGAVAPRSSSPTAAAAAAAAATAAAEAAEAEADAAEAERLLEELFGPSLKPELLAMVGHAERSAPLQLLEMLAFAHDRATQLAGTAAASSSASSSSLPASASSSTTDIGAATLAAAAAAGGGLFVRNLLADVGAEIVTAFGRYVGRQISDMRSWAKSVTAKRCGILAPVANFVPWIMRAEIAMRELTPSQRAAVLQIQQPPPPPQQEKSGGGAEVQAGGATGIYTTLIDAIDEALEAVASSDERYLYLVRMENYRYLHETLRRVAHIGELASSMRMAEQCCELNRQAYVKLLLHRHACFASVHAYFEQLLASKIELAEVQYQAAFARPALGRALHTVRPEAVRKAVAALRGKLRRQLTDDQLTRPPPPPPDWDDDSEEEEEPEPEEEEPEEGGGRPRPRRRRRPRTPESPPPSGLALVWGALSETLLQRWREYERLCRSCYGDGGGGGAGRMPLSSAELQELLAAGGPEGSGHGVHMRV